MECDISKQMHSTAKSRPSQAQASLQQLSMTTCLRGHPKHGREEEEHLMPSAPVVRKTSPVHGKDSTRYCWLLESGEINYETLHRQVSQVNTEIYTVLMCVCAAILSAKNWALYVIETNEEALIFCTFWRNLNSSLNLAKCCDHMAVTNNSTLKKKSFNIVSTERSDKIQCTIWNKMMTNKNLCNLHKMCNAVSIRYLLRHVWNNGKIYTHLWPSYHAEQLPH